MLSFFVSRSNDLIFKNERGDTFSFKRTKDGGLEMVKYHDSPIESLFLANERNILEAMRRLIGNGNGT